MQAMLEYEWPRLMPITADDMVGEEGWGVGVLVGRGWQAAREEVAAASARRRRESWSLGRARGSSERA
jgi:hypothetical protein